MKNISIFLLLFSLVFLAAVPKQLKASHAQGADFSYSCLGGDTIQISLSFFRDCSGIAPDATATVNVSSISCGQNLNVNLLPTITETEVSGQFICPSQLGNTTCGNGNLPGTTRTIYTGVIVLPQSCSDWVLSYDLCCRNPSTNLQGSVNADIYVASTLNNTNNNAQCNSSPIYGSIPIVFTCANQPFSYNPNAVDLDGDSLSFTLINPLSGPGQNIPHTNPFSATNPLNTTGGFSFDPRTGQMNFIPSGQQSAVITTLVSEFRNGVLVGTTIRDLQVVIVNCGASTPPVLTNIDSLQGGTQNDTLTVSVCPGESIQFTITATDNPGDDLTLTTNVNQTIPNATFTVADLGNVIRMRFSWVPSVLDTGINFFTVTISDSLSCPIRSSITKSFIIDVLDATDAGPDLFYCPAGGPVQLQAIGGNSFTWTPAAGLSNPNIPNPTAAPQSTTSYIVTSDLSALCKNRDTVTVFRVDDFLFSITNDTGICRNGSVPLEVITDPSFAPFQYLWTPSNTLSANNIFNPIAFPQSTTKYNVSITAANGCTIRDSVTVTITGVGPLVVITPSKNNVCLGDTIQLDAQFFNLQCGPTIASCSAQNPPVLRPFGTGVITSIVGATPFPGNSQDARTQILYRAADLNAAGIVAGTIVGIQMNIGAWTSIRAYENFTMKLGCTSQSNLSVATGFLPVSTTVLGPTNIVTQNGINNFNFAVPYDWDGISNLVLEICYDNATQNAGGNDQVLVTPASYTAMLRNNANNSTGCNLNAAFANQEFPNTSFRICGPLPSNTTFTWSPTLGLSNPNSLNPFVVLNNNQTYTLNVDDGQCVGSGSVTLTIDGSFSIQASVDSNFQCGNDSAQLLVEVLGTPPTENLNCGTNGNTCVSPNLFVVGTGTNQNTTTTYPAPFGDWFESSKQQYLYRAGELTAAGINSGTISSIAFNVSSIAGTTVYRNYTVKISCTSLNSLNPASFESGLVTVFNPKTVNINTGWNNLPFDQTFDWDGTSNIIIEICHNNNISTLTSDFTNNSVSPRTVLTYTAALIRNVDDVDACPSNTPTSNSQNRPNTRFFVCDPPPSVQTSIVWTPNNTLINPNTANPIATPSAPTTYVVNYTFSNGCVLTDSVTVSPIDFDAIVSANVSICEGENTTLTVNGGTSYSWTPATGLNTTMSNIVIASPDTTTVYFVTTFDALTGCSDVDTIIVTVNPLPQITFAGLPSVCFTDSLILDAGAGFESYFWLPTQDTTQTITITDPGNFLVTVRDTNSCENSASISANFGNPPVVDLGSDIAFCEDDVVDLIAPQGLFTYLWNTTETTQQITVSSGGLFYVEVTGADGCFTRDSIMLTLVSPDLSIGNDTIICAGEILTLTAGPLGPQYLWSTLDTTPSINVSQSGVFSVMVTLLGNNVSCVAEDTIQVTVNNPIVVDLGNDSITCSGNPLVLNAGSGFVSYNWSPNNATSQSITVGVGNLYSVTVTDQFGCTGNASINVTDINPDVNLGADIALCQGESVVLTAATNATNPSFTWLPDNQITNSITVNLAGTYIAIVIDENGCFASDTINVTVFSIPIPNLGPDQTVCNNELVTLNTGGGTFTAFEWSTLDTSATIDIDQSGTFAVTVTDANGCTGTDTMNLTVLPAINLVLPDTMICKGDSILIIAPDGFDSYLWTGGSTTQDIIVNNPGEIILQVTDANGCTETAIGNVEEYLYALEAAALPVEINKGDTAQLNANVSGGSGNYTFEWTPAQGLNNNSIANPLAYPEDTTIYTVSVTDAVNACKVGTDTVLIIVISEPFIAIPDAFTPDGDGRNDFFEVSLVGNITLEEFKIYNRWGEQIHNSTMGWDGTYKGKQQPVGTYVYMIVVRKEDGSKQILKEAFTLIR